MLPDRGTIAPGCNDESVPGMAAARPRDVEPIAGPLHITPPRDNPTVNVGTMEAIIIEDDDLCQAELLGILGIDPTEI